jgi:hypothetical protein
MWVIQRHKDHWYYQRPGDAIDLPETFTPNIADAYTWTDETKAGGMVFIYAGESWVWVPETDTPHTD